MKIAWIHVVGGVVLTLLILGSVYFFAARSSQRKVQPVTPTPAVAISSTPSLSPTVPQTPISVTSPKAHAAVALPLVITGKARVFENQFDYRIKDADGSILSQGNVTAANPDVNGYGSFTVSITALPSPKGVTGTIEVFDYSAKDGSEIDTVTIPVTFALEKNPMVQVFFGRQNAATEGTCENVISVFRRIAATPSVAKVALEEDLKGPTDREKTEGFSTSIPPGVVVQRLAITNGTAQGDFNSALEQGVGGSCRVAAIRAQITKTLLQFSSVKTVRISINGRTEDILQP